MGKYTIYFNHAKRNGEENLLIMEFERKGLTSHEYKDYIVNTLFDLSDARHKYLTAYVVRDGAKVLTVRCHRITDGEKPVTYIYAARPREVFHIMRVMNNAE